MLRGICARDEQGKSAPGAQAGYARREPEKTVLYKVIQEHLESFLAEYPGLPAYVVEEFRSYLDCGILARGHVLLKCGVCGREAAVAFSCKGRTFCPSCLTRRMHATAMDLEGRVLPVAAYRHWVLAFPMQVRFHLARDEELLGKLRQIFVRAVHTWLRAKARKMGVARPLTGAVAFTQRFSSRLMLYPHVHCVIPDGVFAQGEDGKLVFHELRPKDEDVAKIAKRIAKRSHRLLATLEEIDPDALDQVRGQAIQGELALKIVPVEAVEEVKGRLLANVEGFSLQAQRRLHQSDRRGLEFLLRYVLRPPFALERMRQLPSGKIELGLKRPLGNGLATIELTPMALLRRLASIVPPPGNHDTSYFGVFAAHSKWRRQLVRPRRKDPEDCQTHPGLEERDGPVVDVTQENSAPESEEPDEPYIPWAKLLKHVFGIDALRCECGGRMVVKQYVTAEEKIRQNLERLGLWEEPPKVANAREPEQVDHFDLPSFCDGVDPPAPDDVA